MTHYKTYTLTCENFAVKIDTDDNDDVEIQVYNNRVGYYQYVFPESKLYQDIKKAFLDDKSVELDITEGS